MTHLDPRLGRADGVDDDGVGGDLEEAVLDGGVQGGAAAAEGEEAREVVVAAFELVDEGPGHRIADDLEPHGTLAHDRVPDGGRVDARRVVAVDDGVTGGERGERGPLRRAVHERRQHHEAGAAPRGGLDHRVEAGVGLGLAEGPAAHGAEEAVVLAPQHAFGHAGGAAGVEDVEVVG